ncbi:NAD-P-binding protein [Cucurbitaria berberidis CBS 394.84]|uniref:NAD-P-binding protein n=1 Tax=Cucurbitaria berberidis CBS 394.84 TaxID=1168544 RepID=A0A9P4GUH9_9PLEO|nr:NAD-P-binding protein [Cucurbitaria berberidis CBS 394.84]KAF1851759.1 NAD-P-binding protein [Cucurbitaria berberidis CBS 394.84]
MTSQTTNIAWTVPATASAVTDLIKQSKPVPTPGPKQVLVQLTAAALNYRDLLISIRSPQYPGNHKADLVPGADGAGIICSVGEESKWGGSEGLAVLLHPNNWISGDVQALSFETILGGTSKDGTLQHYLAVDDECIVEAPKSLSATESASLVTAGATAWAAIRESLDMTLKGRTVLTMGTGGVSCFGIQIAAALGATVIATSSSDSKLDFAMSLGATHVVNYSKTPDWDQEVLRITAGRGVDHVIETGGAGTLMKSINSTRTGGLISLLGALTPDAPIDTAFVPSVLFGGKFVKGCVAFSRDLVAELASFVEANSIKPVIAHEFGFEHLVEAFEALQKQQAVGKIAVKIT